MQFTFIISLFFAILVALFAILNAETVTINVLFSKFQTSQAVVILVSAALGAVVVYMLSLIKKIKSSLKLKESEKKVKTYEIDNKKLTEELESFKEKNIELMEELENLKNSKVEVNLKK